MGEPWSDIAALLRQQKLLAPQSLRQRLLSLENPRNVIQSARALNFSGGMLTSDMLDALVAHADGHTSSTPNNLAQVVAQPANDLARTIAPMKEPEPIDIHLRNNLPDWNQSDFSMHASDAPSDITVHYDITGNSTTEGKMSDITACFNDRLQSIRNSSFKIQTFPESTKRSPGCRLNFRYQGYENKAVAIGLVNEPRYTKNGHLMWGLEDETGEITSLAHEAIGR